MRVGIVGCGIIGAYLAWKLAQKAEVTVFELKNTIGKEACSGLISRRLFGHIPANESLVENVLREIELKFPERTVSVTFFPRMLAVNRANLDRYVAGLAQKAGAKILLGHKVEKIIHMKGKRTTLLITHRGENKYYEFDYLIGCDGPLSVVRRALRLPEPRLKLGILTYINKKDSSDIAKITAFPNGFGWVLPRGKRTEVGILEKPQTAKKLFQKFCRKLRLKPKKICSALIPEGLIISNNSRIALCGDAAGLTKPWSSGGIIWELTAADLLVKHFPNIKKYNSALRRFFEPRVFFSRILTKAIVWLGFNLPWLLPKKAKFDPDWAF